MKYEANTFPLKFVGVLNFRPSDQHAKSNHFLNKVISGSPFATQRCLNLLLTHSVHITCLEQQIKVATSCSAAGNRPQS